MNYRSPTINRETRLYKSISRRAAAEILRGRVLVIDPSCGSQSSIPGYAIYVEGQLWDSGTVDMPIGESLDLRLRYLAACLRAEFPHKFDALVVEDVPSHRFSRGRGGRTHANLRSQMSLHYACAVIISAVDAEHVVRISPATWWTFAPENYAKSDESDAVVMGHAVLEVARHVVEFGHLRRQKRPRKSTTKSKTKQK